MAFTGISKETWQNTEAKSGFKLMPVGFALEQEIEEVREGVEKSGDNEYVMFKCVHIDDEGESYTNWEYFQLSDERLGFLKAFLEKVGRCDMMAEDADWEDMVGTQFTADVKHTKRNGETYVNFVLNSIEAVSHDVFEIPTEDADLDSKIEEEAERNAKEAEETQKALKAAKALKEKGPKPASKASPRRPRTAGANR
jgi:hypothetical protein